jgi:hypothetical protein
MNKKLITTLLTLTLLTPTVANAALKNQTVSTPASIAILDTAIDSSLPIFKDKIVQEVCLIDWTTCPNGKSFMEGPGSAGMPADIINLNGFDHGTQMASIVVKNNPNVKIVFIKIIGNKPNGVRQVAFESAVFNALNWVYANKDKYNIQAVTMSQGHHNLGAAGTDYCPKTPVTKTAIQNLISVGIPTFFPSGNGRDYQRIDWPACIDESISVGAVDQINEITTYSNTDSLKLDFFTLGNMPATGPGNVEKNVTGTSASVQIAASQWVSIKQLKSTLTYQQIIDLLKKTSIPTKGRQGNFNNLISLSGAING